MGKVVRERNNVKKIYAKSIFKTQRSTVETPKKKSKKKLWTLKVIYTTHKNLAHICVSDEISERTKAWQPLQVSFIWSSLNFWMHMSNSSMFQYSLHNMLFFVMRQLSTKITTNVWSKCQPQNVLVQWQFVFKHFDTVIPRRRLTIDQKYLDTARLQTMCSQKEVATELRVSQGVISSLQKRRRDWKTHRNAWKWTFFGHIPWWWRFHCNQCSADNCLWWTDYHFMLLFKYPTFMI